jgi:hypothetical protein
VTSCRHIVYMQTPTLRTSHCLQKHVYHVLSDRDIYHLREAYHSRFNSGCTAMFCCLCWGRNHKRTGNRLVHGQLVWRGDEKLLEGHSGIGLRYPNDNSVREPASIKQLSAPPKRGPMLLYNNGCIWHCQAFTVITPRTDPCRCQSHNSRLLQR